MESSNLSAALRLTPGPIRAVCKSTKVAPNLFVVANSRNLLKTKCQPLCNLPNLFCHAHGQCFTLAVGLGSISYFLYQMMQYLVHLSWTRLAVQVGGPNIRQDRRGRNLKAKI